MSHVPAAGPVLPRTAAGRATTRPRRPSAAVLVVLCAAQLMTSLDSTVVNVALPAVRRSLALSPAGMQWVVDGYTLALAALLLLGGRLADVLGRKRTFLLGLGLFTLASLAGGFAPDAAALVAARTVQGAGAAILSPATMSLLTAAYPDPDRRRRALGVWTAAASSGGALGAVLGGVLTQTLGWHWVLWVNVPVGLAVFRVGARVLTEAGRRPHGLSRLDLPGALTVGPGLAALVYAVVGTGTTSWTSLRTLLPAAAGVTLLAAFVVVERRAKCPLLPLGLFRLRAVACANGQALLMGAGISAMFYFLSLYLQTVLGLPPLLAGVAFMPGSLGMLAGSALGTRLIASLSPRLLLGAAGMLALGGVLWLSAVPVGGSYATDVLPPVVLATLGVGMGFVPITTAAVQGVAATGLGVATGLLKTSQEVGSTVGLAALATVATSVTARPLAAAATGAARLAAVAGGYHAALLAAAGLVLLEIGVVMVMPRLTTGAGARTAAPVLSGAPAR
ncbi:DHA2 family efflux MFS transporter permease subunit [Streptantibioticus silvisoli]|uniref:DHA2 family efflux MFS transporter permease subunit n=1 Tax=Streptantibioticus silvisoli TaxID=2705255 RepID=A0ABT6VZC0_9ACTN|nr:DHA2 family efflux MFS transporter permease subunit [Streptantibioticus silvisoli]MDI5963379.1 DHA2 family efflux MFS transporter permease subunit [Streptantibioticus silvisoli]